MESAAAANCAKTRAKDSPQARSETMTPSEIARAIAARRPLTPRLWVAF